MKFVLALLIACGACGACGASVHEKTIAAASASADAATALWDTYDLAHQRTLVAACPDAACAHAAVEAWRANQVAVEKARAALYQAIAAAATVDNDPNLAGMVKAALMLQQTLHDLGVTK